MKTIARTATVTAAAACLATAGIAVGTSIASATPVPAQTLSSSGNTVWVYGLGGCQGSVTTQILTDSAAKGEATIIITPQTATSPGCQADLITNWLTPLPPFTGQQTNRVAVSAPGKPTRFTIKPGSGYAAIGFATGGQSPMVSYVVIP